MTYRLIKRVIESGNYHVEDMAVKLDMFFTFDRITKEQYEELTGMVEARQNGGESM